MLVEKETSNHAGNEGGKGETGEEHTAGIQNGVTDQIVNDHCHSANPWSKVVTDQGRRDKAEAEFEDGWITD